ncbi:MAG: hypothetical protein ABIJ16_06600 [Bacteroidota bacterium]
MVGMPEAGMKAIVLPDAAGKYAVSIDEVRAMIYLFGVMMDRIGALIY